MTKFTEGEWVVDNAGFFTIVSFNGLIVCNEIHTNSDAHLIAAAPDMYKCIKAAAKLFMELDGLVHDNIELDAVAANLNGLLAKARGEL